MVQIWIRTKIKLKYKKEGNIASLKLKFANTCTVRHGFLTWYKYGLERKLSLSIKRKVTLHPSSSAVRWQCINQTGFLIN